MGAAKYGGLNVHPSMLPDLYGPAPLHHALLSGDIYTGVTVQTLHPKRFDQGTVLLQTPYPGIECKGSNVKELSQMLAPEGASILIDCIKKQLYVNNPGFDRCEKPGDRGGFENARPAPKITPADRLLKWDSWIAAEIIRRQQVIGPLWSLVQLNGNIQRTKRLIWTMGFEEIFDGPVIDYPVGQPIIKTANSSTHDVFVRTCDNHLLKVNDITIEGGRRAQPLEAIVRAGMQHPNATVREGYLIRGDVLSCPHSADKTQDVHAEAQTILPVDSSPE